MAGIRTDGDMDPVEDPALDPGLDHVGGDPGQDQDLEDQEAGVAAVDVTAVVVIVVAIAKVMTEDDLFGWTNMDPPPELTTGSSLKI